MTNEEAVALALYETAEFVLRESRQMRVGSGARLATEKIGHNIYRRAKVIDLGELDDPAIHRTADDLLRNIAERIGPLTALPVDAAQLS